MATGTAEAVNHSTIHDDEIAVVTCETSKGTMVWELYRYWSPAGYDQLVSLMERRYFDHSHFFRTVPDFLVQFGISYTADKALQSLANQQIPDDPQHEPPIPFTFGTISYAGSGPNSRTSQLFISLRKDGGAFGTQLWETPVGKVVNGFDTVVQHFYSDYGDMPPWGKGPIQHKIHGPEGLSYISQNFPLLDSFIECEVVRQPPGDGSNADLNSHRELIAENVDQRPHHLPHNVRSPKHLHHRSHKEGDVMLHYSAGDSGESTSHHNPIDEQPQRVITAAGGELHHAHTVHFNAAPNEEGLTKLSWELVASCLLLFAAVLMLWLRFALCSPTKLNAARRRKSK